MIVAATLIIFFCYFTFFLFLPFMNRLDKKRKARVAAFKKRLTGIGKPEAGEVEEFVEEIGEDEEAAKAVVVAQLPRP